MPSREPQHFDTYTIRNRVKHQILTGYLVTYLTALRNLADSIHYIDGFAGRGYYAEGEPGSPLQALDMLAKQPLPAFASFVEDDRDNFEDLSAAISACPAVNCLNAAPLVCHGSFENHVLDVLRSPAYRNYKRVATFAFVDPCGVKGVRMQDLVSLLDCRYGEILLLWNYDGLNRWLGYVAKQQRSVTELEEFFGSVEVAGSALELVRSRMPSADKEFALLELFFNSLKLRSGAQFMLPFRFEADAAERTSHYLIHCSKHGLAFRLMKEVMGSAATNVSESGTFQCLGAKQGGLTLDLFDPHLDDARARVLQHLTGGPAPVSLFTEVWAERPDDLTPGSTYRRLLLALEKEGKILARDRKGQLKPADKRRKYFGNPTLGADYQVQLAT